MRYLENDMVTMHSLGSDHGNRKYRGRIRGIAIDTGEQNSTIYIVEMIDKLSSKYAYSCCTMPGACLKEGWHIDEYVMPW